MFTVNNVLFFDSFGAYTEIRFCLDAIDCQGNLTTGIIKKTVPSNTSFKPFLNMNKIKS